MAETRSNHPPLKYVDQGRGPLCSAAASLMALSRFYPPPTLKRFVRELTVRPEGVALLDIAERIQEKFDIEVRILTTNLNELKSWLDDGLPVVLLLRDGLGRHAVVAHAADKVGLKILDPANPGKRYLSDTDMEKQWSAGQAVVFFVASNKTPLNLRSVDARDRHFRAREWGIRAAEVIDRPTAALKLYQRAISLDQNIAELHFNMGVVLRSLNRKAAACKAFARALTLKPKWSSARQARQALDCP